LLHNAMRHTNGSHIGVGDRIALLFSYSFGAAMGNIFSTLLNGATLLPFNLRELGVARLADWLIEREITQFHTVPTVFRQFTEVLSEDHVFPRLRLIKLGGETMFAKDVERFKRHFGAHCLLTIGMGTSESGHLFEFGVDKDTECPTDLLPVGYAVEDTETFLLDANGEPVGVGRVGEIAVRGSFVSPGYWRCPELTAKKFRPDPQGGKARIYLTGDLGCMLPDGCVFHLGRNDARARIRGQSVEIPEVEAALLQVPGVNEVAVVAEEKLAGRRLPLDTLFQAPTIEQLAGILGQKAWSAPLSSLVALQPNGSKPPFFWVLHGEKSRAFLRRYFAPDQPVYGLSAQSLDGKRALYTRIEDIAAHYLKGLRGVQPNGPYFLGGFCFGGIVAFEIAQQLRRQGQEVALLVLLDPPGPVSSPRVLEEPPLFSERVYRQLRNAALLEPQEKLAYMWDTVVRKTKEQLTKITDTARKAICHAYLLTGTDLPMPPWLRNLYIDIVHRRARRGYVPQVYPGRVVVIKVEGSSADRGLAWGRLAAGGLEIYEVPGQHSEILSDETQVQGLAKQMKACLDRAQLPGVQIEVGRRQA
jgi:thioesterase domain-containing protein